MKTLVYSPTQVTHSVASEVRLAYDDATANLHFKASLPVTVKEAIDIFKNIDPDFEYNEFKPDLLKHFGMNTMVTIAREYSVCIYVHAKDLNIKQLQRKMKADEFALGYEGYKNDPDIYRIWWD